MNIDWRILLDHLRKDGLLHRRDVVKLIDNCLAVLRGEPNLVYVSDPVTIVGDIHGQFYDLVKLLTVGGDPETNKYVFLGDYVDRGNFGLEVLLLLMALKISLPKSVFLLRGNHESRQMTISFNFRQEVLAKYDQEIFDRLMDVFDAMPVSAVINQKFIAFHGGISPEIRTLEDINKFDRFKEPPKTGVLW